MGEHVSGPQIEEVLAIIKEASERFADLFDGEELRRMNGVAAAQVPRDTWTQLTGDTTASASTP